MKILFGVSISSISRDSEFEGFQLNRDHGAHALMIDITIRHLL